MLDLSQKLVDEIHTVLNSRDMLQDLIKYAIRAAFGSVCIEGER